VIKLNLGSGFNGLNDWLNYDNSIVAAFSRWPSIIRLLIQFGFLPSGYKDIKWPPIIVRDCRKGIPHENGSVDFIYTSHFLEHLYRHEVVDMLKECYRVLKPGGTLRIALPDVDKLIALYAKHDPSAFPYTTSIENPKPNHTDMFMAFFYTSEFNRNSNRSFIGRIQELFLRHHQWMYNVESIRLLLEYSGFNRIEQKNFQECNLADVRQLDCSPEISFYVEAYK